MQALSTTPTTYALINWTVAGTSTTFSTRVYSNITWPLSSLSTTRDDNVGIDAVVTNIQGGGAYTAINVVGYSMTTGAQLWNTTVQNEFEYSGSCCIADHGLIAVCSSTGHWLAWNLATGALAWTGQEMDYPWGASAFGAYAVQSAYGLFYWETYDGIYGYNWTNGQIAWHFKAQANYPFDTNYYDNGTALNPFDEGAMVAGGMIYSYNNEHSAINPVARGWNLYTVNATTGAEVWNCSTPGGIGAISDGYMFADSYYDGYMYVFGRGQSATAVTATPEGTSVLIQGTVLDKSPSDQGSTTNPTARLDSPTNVPCVSDASMSSYMNYLYMQIPIPSGYSVTGVPVQLYATDQSGNTISIGTTTTGGLTGFNYAWTPPSSGLWTIQAVFAGDDSYGSSFAGTGAIYNAPAATPTPAPTTISQSNLATTTDIMTYIAVVGIAIIIAIAIATVLLLRKRP